MKIILLGVNCALMKCLSIRSRTINISSVITNQAQKIETNSSIRVNTAILFGTTEQNTRHILIDIGT